MAYTIDSPYAGAYNVTDSEDGERVARVARFMPGPMVLVEGPKITSPDCARAIAEAMLMCARDVENYKPSVED